MRETWQNAPDVGPAAILALGMDARLFASATQRNRGPILDVLRRMLPASGALLEIASGTGEHAVWFAAQLPGFVHQPSDPSPRTARASSRGPRPPVWPTFARRSPSM